jgi:hypothetical protein
MLRATGHLTTSAAVLWLWLKRKFEQNYSCNLTVKDYASPRPLSHPLTPQAPVFTPWSHLTPLPLPTSPPRLHLRFWPSPFKVSCLTSRMGVWHGVAMDSLKFHPGPPCPTFLLPYPAGGRPVAVSYPPGHPTPYAYDQPQPETQAESRLGKVHCFSWLLLPLRGRRPLHHTPKYLHFDTSYRIHAVIDSTCPFALRIEVYIYTENSV